MSTRTPSPSVTSDGKGKKRKASSPLAASGTPTQSRVIEAFVDVNKILAKLKRATEKMSPTKKSSEPSIKTLVLLLDNKIQEYGNSLDEALAVAQEEAAVAAAAKGNKPETKEAGTDMALTPEWWVPTRPVSLNGGGRPVEAVHTTRSSKVKQTKSAAVKAAATTPVRGHAGTRSYAGAASQPPPPATTDMEESAFATVTRKKGAKRPVAQKAAAAPRRLPPKKPAVLIKVPEGASYADTVRALRAPGAVTTADIASVTGVRKTREGHVLVELKRSAGAFTTAASLTRKFAESLGEKAAAVMAVGHTTEVDLDAAATREEVLTALKKAATDNGVPPEAITEIRITGLWSTWVGQQVASATVPAFVATKITRVPVGWTMCRVSPRRPVPVRCYRCHDFGHQSATCKGPDLSGTCRKCGEKGHKAPDCPSGSDRCVACERAGHPRVNHRPG